MKYLVPTAVFALFIMSCKSTTQKKASPQLPLEVETLIGEEGETVVLGYMNRANLDTPEFQAWFQPEYNNIKIPEGWAEEFAPLAKNLELQVVAEGVETIEQLNYLRDKHCEIIQGYYYSKPVSSIEIQDLMEKKTWE